ncbi:MAG: ORF6N domain-containing protein [Planctomycetes bacterium]|nr:ORF6N domain-containing protein [Planctomycetota bacterium]
MNERARTLVPSERVEKAILLIRGQKVILDRDLAMLYGISTSNLNKAVSRNLDRFPEDFMLQLTRGELENLRFQFGTSRWGGTRKPPRAFTEQGVAMLSGVLRGKLAVRVNIEIMRAFVRLRAILGAHKDLSRRLNDLEQKYDSQFRIVFDAIRQLMEPPDPERRPIGFRAPGAGGSR